MSKKKLAFLGCGFLNQIVANAVKDGIIPEYEIVGAMGRDFGRTKEFADHFSCTPCKNIDELMALEPDFVAEAASADSVTDYAETILKGGSSILVLSAAAFADTEFYENLKKTAVENNTRIYIPGGAVGGFDFIRAASLMSPTDSTMTSARNPRSYYYTPYNREGLLNIKEPERLFTGDVRQLMDEFPYSYNVVMATSLACGGPEKTKFNINADPKVRGDEYNIRVVGRHVAMDLNIYSINYGIAGWSVVAMLQNIVSPVVF